MESKGNTDFWKITLKKTIKSYSEIFRINNEKNTFLGCFHGLCLFAGC